jgi:hypothetical protein
VLAPVRTVSREDEGAGGSLRSSRRPRPSSPCVPRNTALKVARRSPQSDETPARARVEHAPRGAGFDPAAPGCDPVRRLPDLFTVLHSASSNAARAAVAGILRSRALAFRSSPARSLCVKSGHPLLSGRRTPALSERAPPTQMATPAKEKASSACLAVT